VSGSVLAGGWGLSSVRADDEVSVLTRTGSGGLSGSSDSQMSRGWSDGDRSTSRVGSELSKNSLLVTGRLNVAAIEVAASRNSRLVEVRSHRPVQGRCSWLAGASNWLVGIQCRMDGGPLGAVRRHEVLCWVRHGG
jgi:hypothetical protein